MTEVISPTALAPELDSPPLSPRISAFRGGEEEEEEPGTPVRPGSGLLDKGSVQRLASRLNERIASEEQSCSPTARLSVSPSPMKLANKWEKQLQRSQSPDSPDRSVPRSPSPLKKDSRITDALAGFKETPKAKTGFRTSASSQRRHPPGSSPGKTDVVPLTMSPKLATRFALRGGGPKGSSEMHSEWRSNRLATSMPEAFAALREIEDAMRIIEKTESPLHFQGHCTFDNTFWEPSHEASAENTREAGRAVMSGLVEGHSDPHEAPDKQLLEKAVAKELFPACKPAEDEDGPAAASAKPLDLGHILAGIPGSVPAHAAEGWSARSDGPALPDPFSEPATTPSKTVNSTAEDAAEEEWEFPQTPGSLKGTVSSKLWPSPSVSPVVTPLPAPQAATGASAKTLIPDVQPLSQMGASTTTMCIIVNILVVLLGGTALLIASSMPLGMPANLRADLQPQNELDTLPAPLPHTRDDSHALAHIPAHRAGVQEWSMSGMAASALEVVRAIPLPAAEHLQAPAAAVHAAAGAIKEHAGVVSSHLLVHGPYVAMLAAEALVLYCVTRLALSLMEWRCGNPCCARRGKLKRRRMDGCTMCGRCAQWALRHEGQFWGSRTACPAWAKLPGGRTTMCMLRNMGLGSARET